MIVYKMYGFPSDKEAKEELRKTGKLQQAGINELYTVRSFELIVEFSCLKNQTMVLKNDAEMGIITFQFHVFIYTIT